MINLDKLNEFTESRGALRTGKGLVSGVIALTLAVLCLLAFHFLQYLTMPQLRKSYDVSVIRTIMLVAMAIAGGISLVNILFNRTRWLATFAFSLVALAALLGGPKVAVDPNFPNHTPNSTTDTKARTRKRWTRTTLRTSLPWITCSA